MDDISYKSVFGSRLLSDSCARMYGLTSPHNIMPTTRPASASDPPALDRSVTAEVAKLGGLRLHLASPATTWPNLPTTLQTALLLGNPVPALLFTIPEESLSQTAKLWHGLRTSSNPMATLPHIRNLLKARRERIAVLYPPTSSSDHAQHKTRHTRPTTK